MSLSFLPEELTVEDRGKIRDQLKFQAKTSRHQPPAPVLRFYNSVDGKINLPYHFARNLRPQKELPNPQRYDHFKFTGELRKYQPEDVELALAELKKQGSILICFNTGVG